jgi:GT2 family glycosyltransferase
VLPVVIPSAAASPHLAACVASLPSEAAVYVVSEVDPSLGTHVPVSVDAGFARRANAGLAAAQADGHRAALLLNDDTELEAGVLPALSSALTRSRIVGAVLECWTGGVQQAGLSVSRRSGRVVARTSDPGATEARVDAVAGAALALDLDLWSELEGFDERFDFYFEDVDLCLRARALGVRPLLVGSARIRHRGGGTQSLQSPEAAHQLGRSHTLLVRSLRGGRVARSLRLTTVITAGTVWTLRSVGARGLGAFARGVRAGLES